MPERLPVPCPVPGSGAALTQVSAINGRDVKALRFDSAGLVSLEGEPFASPGSGGRLHIAGRSPEQGRLFLDVEEGPRWEPYTSVGTPPGLNVTFTPGCLPEGARLRLRLQTQSTLLPTSAEFSAQVSP